MRYKISTFSPLHKKWIQRTNCFNTSSYQQQHLYGFWRYTVKNKAHFHASLETVDLDDRPIYNCLSYAWGDPDPVGALTRAEAVDYSLNSKMAYILQQQAALRRTEPV